MKNKFFRKLISAVATAALLFNSLAPSMTVLAQTFSPDPTSTATPTETPTATPTNTATPAVTASPTDTPTAIPTDTALPVASTEANISTATPDATLTPIPTATDTASPTDSPVVTPTDQPTLQPTDNYSQNASSNSLTPSPSAQPTVTLMPQAPVEHGTLNETVINGVDLSGVTGLTNSVDSNGAITTNQSDYSPTSLVLITGTGFIANKTYTINIVSTDTPPVNFTDQVKADSTGKISYAYQLDGNYRPNYTVYIKDGKAIIATITFTDSGNEWPCKNFNCTAGDVTAGSFTLVDPNTLNPITSCTNGATISATLLGTFINHTGTNRYASVLIGDVYQGNNKIFSFNTSGTPGVCAGDVITSNSSINTQVGQTFSWTCGQTVSVQNFNVSWSTTSTTCSAFFNNPSCSPRNSQCSAGSSLSVSGPGQLIVHKTFTDSHTNSGITINITGTNSGTGITDTNGNATFEPGNGTYTAHAVEPSGYYESANTCINVSVVAGQTTNCTITDSPATGTITIVKNTTGGNGTFNFTVTGPSSSTPSVPTTGGTGTTGALTVNTGTYSVSETVPSGWTLTSSSCTSGTPASFSVTGGGNVTCTFNNTKLSNLTIVKNTVGGDGTFNFTTTGSGISNFSLTTSGGTANKAFSNINAGSYSVAESVPAGWVLTSSGCDNGNSPSTVTLGAGQNVTCTFTNTKLPQLTVHKIVINHGLSYDTTHFTPYKIDSTSVNLDQAYTENVGSHTVTETSDSNYTATFSGACDTNGNVTLAAGDNKTCTITNEEKLAHLTVNKIVINHGLSFDTTHFAPYKVDSTTVTLGVSNVFNSGSHTVTETSDTHYNASFSGDCNSQGVVTLNSGDNKTCTITNEEKPTYLTVTKILTPSNDPGLFNLQIDGSTKVSNVGNNGTTGQILVNSGTHSISELAGTGTNLSNYTPVIGGDCASNGSITLTSGDNKICTITNTRNTTDLKVKKVVDDGSPLTNWSFSLDGAGAVTADSNGNVDFGPVTTNVTHTITEGGANGSNYTLVSVTGNPVSCTQSGANAGTVNIPNGSSGTTCTFTNNVHRGTINVTKYNDLNADGSNKSEPVLSGWTINLTGQTSLVTNGSGVASFTNLLPGTYTVSENLQNGWNQSNISCDNGSYSNQNQNFTLNIAPGQSVNCSIGNYQNANLTVAKIVIDPNGNPVTDTTNFAFVAAGNNFNLENGQSQGFSLKPGTYSVSETPNTNYSLIGCTNLTAGQITLTSGQNITVTCTNQQKIATITVVKQVVLSDGKTPVLDGHSFTAQLNGANNKTFSEGNSAVYTVNPGGPYTIGETTDPNYTNLGCLLPTGAPATSMTLGSNQSVTVTCTNEQNPGTISGYKFQSDNVTPISGWTVNLLSCTSNGSGCSSYLTTTTNGSGFYSFTNLITGFYQVVENLVSTYTPMTPTSLNETVTPGASITQQNFANFKNINITVCKKQDADGNLTTTNDQTSILGWGMTLSSDGKQLGGAQTTGDNGCTTFSNLGPNHDYSVTEENRSGWTNLTPLTHDFGTPSDGQNQSWTFINFHNVSISGEKFNDVNGNGQLDNGEPGLQGWTIDLEDTNGNIITSTTTDSNGNYSFTNLGPGTYRIREVGQIGWVQMTVNPSDLSVVSGQNITGINFGNQGQGTVTVTKYQDNNANGTFDKGETVLGSWTIYLDRSSQTTGLDGTTTFTGVPAGAHTVSEFIENGWNQSNITCDGGSYNSDNQNNTFNVSAGSQINCYVGNYQNAHLTVTKHVISPTGDEVVDSTSFAFSAAGNNFNLANGQSQSYDLKPATYSVSETTNPNYTFNGCSNLSNGQITLTSGESVTVTCTNQQKTANITVVKSVVGSDGQTPEIDGHTFQVTLNGQTKDFSEGNNAVFTVNPGTYSATESADPNYTLLTNSSPATVGSNGSATIYITNEQDPGTISGHKYQSDNATPISGWTINLLSCTANGTGCSSYLSTTTDTNGFYNFTNLLSGFYQVVESLNTNYTPMTATSLNETVSAGSNITNQNFANFKNINITVCKKQDADGNLETTNDQTSVLGWGMTLNSDGKPVGDPQTTGDNGCVTFTNLGPGHDYSVTEENRSGWTNLTPLTNDFGTPVDGVNQTYTFVNFHNVSISGEKFNDINGNGKQDEGEPGLSGWTIQLEDTNGNVLATTTTDSNGNYTFSNLGPGTYRVREVGQPGWVQMTVNPSDLSVFSGQNITGINFGNQGQGTVIVTKYLDDNADGRFNQGESVLSDWTINLAGAGTQQTGIDGTTTFIGVPAGSHILSEDLPDGWIQSNIQCDNEEAFVINNGNSHPVRVTTNGTIHCYIGNYQNAHIIVTKKVVDPQRNPIVEGDNTSFGFNVTDQSGFDLSNGESKGFDVRPGNYDVTENLNLNYDFNGCEAVYNSNAIGQAEQGGVLVELGSGDTATVTCTNQQKQGTVNGTKWNDANDNGTFDENESVLSGWTIYADLNHNGQFDNGEPSTTTDNNGNYTLSLNPGTYSICEVMQGGWQQTYPGGESQCHDNVHVYSGQSYDGSLNFGNFLIPVPNLVIAKSNDKSGGMSAGNTVTYTLTVNNNGNTSVNNLKVTDVLPGGFSYVLGTSTLNGSSIPDPSQSGSSLTWNIGTLPSSATATITYQALSASDLSNGTYTNFATCSANYWEERSTSCNTANSNVTIGNGTSYGGNVVGQVLGASTELPGTGSPTGLLFGAFGIIALGFALKAYNSKKGRHAKN